MLLLKENSKPLDALNMALLISFCNQSLTPNLSLLLVDENSLDAQWVELPSFSYDIGGCTGIEKVKDKYYILTQSLKPELLVFNNNFCFAERYPLHHIIDPHSLVYHDSFLYIVSSGDNSVYKVRLSADGCSIEERFWSFPDIEYVKNDVVHLNSVNCYNGELFVTFLGKKREETTWKTTTDGGCYNITRDVLFKTKLYHPHTVKFLNNKILICESNGPRLWYTDWENNCISFNGQLELNGYLRGLDYGQEHYYLGRSERRKISRSRGAENADIEKNTEFFSAAVYKLDRTLTKILGEIDVSCYGSEIYDIMYIPEITLEEKNAGKKRIEELEANLTAAKYTYLQLQQEHQQLCIEYKQFQQSEAVLFEEKLINKPAMKHLVSTESWIMKNINRFLKK